MSVPRIGRADRLAALSDRADGGRAIGHRRNDDPIARLLAAPWPPDDGNDPPPRAPVEDGPTSRPAPARPCDPRAVRERAAQLADLLAPVPGALSEIGTRISRHCAVTARDAELAQVVERVCARTFELWLAVGRLRDAAEGPR